MKQAIIDKLNFLESLLDIYSERDMVRVMQIQEEIRELEQKLLNIMVVE